MVKAYRILAGLIAALVVVQAASMAWGVAGESAYIEGGGVIDKAFIESAQASGELPFPEIVGFIVHGLNGGMLIPAAALLLFLASFRARFPRAVALAGGVLGLVVAQVFMGYGLHGAAWLGLFHGANALAILGLAAYAASRATKATQAPSELDRQLSRAT